VTAAEHGSRQRDAQHDAGRDGAAQQRRIELRGGAHAPALARARLGELLGARLSEDDLFDVIVLVSELVTNAVRHGGAGGRDTIVLRLALAAGVLRIEVCDGGPGFTPPAVLRPRAEGGGNGLILVQRLSSSWGVSRGGSCVWFERALAAS
jgi:anti-sigma regulatory factor (Ser/Thr protein kinase)